MEISALEPNILWKHFDALTKIPRPSKHEQRVVDYIAEFATKHGLTFEVDSVNNIVVKKTASKGMEKKPSVVMQAHVDMVPQKNNDKDFDFTKDAIQTIISDGWVHADGTTLGADNGIGVAAMLAILESDDVQHGPIECLFTIDEETGMTGAFNLHPELLDSEILLNLDSEDEGELFIGCAGGLNSLINIPIRYTSSPKNATSYTLTLSGLKGGHSGLDINLGRGNANKLICRMLYWLIENDGIYLSSVNGGNMHNAIPREAVAVLTVDNDKPNNLEDIFADVQVNIFREFKHVETEMEFIIEETSLQHEMIEPVLAIDIMRTIVASPNGVIRMSDEMQGMVETSLNLATLETKADSLQLLYLLRSSVESAKTFLAKRLRGLYKLIDAEVINDGDYPGWNPNTESGILKTAKDTYKKLYQIEPKIKAIHAGLECGIIGSAYPNMDMISFGPTIRFPHSPDEKVNIESVDKFWKYLLEMLKGVE